MVGTMVGGITQVVVVAMAVDNFSFKNTLLLITPLKEALSLEWFLNVQKQKKYRGKFPQYFFKGLIKH